MNVITTHLESDFDGLASMMAAQRLYPNAILVVPGSCQPGVRTFLERYSLSITQASRINPSHISRLVLVDTQDPERLGVLQTALHNPEISLHIFDHHPGGPQNPTALKADFKIIDSVGATITLLVEEIRNRGISLSPFEATVFAIGLYEETGSLVYPNTTPRDLQIAAYLVQTGADLNVVADYTKQHFTIPQIELLNALLQASQPLHFGKRRIVLALLSWPTYVEDLAPVIQQVVQLEGADAILAAVGMDGKVQFIGRSRHPDIDIHQIAQALGGGGHTMAAAASIKGLTLAEVEDRLYTLLDEQARHWLPIRNLMTAPVRTIQQGTSVKNTERLMTQYEVNSLPVLDSKNRFVGLITREGIQKALFHRLYTVPVEQVMLQDIFTASPDTPFDVVQEHMVERNQRSVPILKNRKVIGIFSRTDLLRAAHQDRVDQRKSGGAQSEMASFRSAQSRNLKGLMADRLPENIQRLLQNAGKVADQSGVSVYVVGGFVRDLWLGNPNLDVDIVVEGDGIRFAKKLAQELHAQIKVHERFGTASLSLSPQSDFPLEMTLDIATARTEYYEYPTALPTVERSSIKKDLYRRDFTINALAIRLNKKPGELLDYFGGQRDLKNKVIRVLHSLSFVEDPTRVFRAIRFEQRFGFTISKETHNFIRNAVEMELFHRVSGHRLGDELIHLLSESKPEKGFRRLQECKLLPFIHPAMQWSSKIDGLFQSIKEILAWHKLAFPQEACKPWLLFAMAFFEPLGQKETVKAWTKLGFPERHIRMVGDFFKEQPQLGRSLLRKQVSRADTHALLNPWPLEPVLYLMAKAQLQESKKLALQRVREFLTELRHITLFITGYDLQKLGLRKGPPYRRILDQLLTARLNGHLQSKKEELNLAKTLVAKEQRSSKLSSKR